MVVQSSEDKLAENSWDESVSVLMDNEPTDFDPMNLDMPYGRQVWDQYHLIGDVLRHQELAFQPSEMFYARLSKALEQEPIHHTQRNSLWPWGLSIAASLVLSVGVWLFVQDPVEESVEPLPAAVSMARPAAPIRAMAQHAESSEQAAPTSARLAEEPVVHSPDTGLFLALGTDKAVLIKEFMAPPSEQQEAFNQANQDFGQNVVRNLIQQHERTAAQRLTMPVSLRGVSAP